MRSHLSRSASLAAAASLFLLVGQVGAGNGDVLQVSSVHSGEETYDLCYDPTGVSGGSFWVVGWSSGFICQVALDLSVVLRCIPNPHGGSDLFPPVLSYGIAYRPSTDTLFVVALRAQQFEVKEVSKADGAELSSFILLTPERASVRGLTYDSLANRLWYLDAENEKVHAVSLAEPVSGESAIELDLPESDTELRGEGLCFELEAEGPRLYVAYGDIFRNTPTRAIQLTMDGDCTGVEVPLDRIESESIRGLQTYRLGAPGSQLRRVAVIGANGAIFNLEQMLPRTPSGALLPAPSHLVCNLTLSNKVALRWINNGPLANGAYGGAIQILRNGTPFVTVAGTSSTYTDATPEEGTSTYAVRASNALGEFSPPGYPCEVTVGAGGLIRWVSFPGAKCYDAAADPVTGNVFVTDDLGIAGQGAIYRFDDRLQPVGGGTLPSPWPHPGGIAWVPAIRVPAGIGQTVEVENCLAVANTNTNTTATQVKIVNLAGQVFATFPLANGVVPNTARIGSLTYVPGARQFAFTQMTQTGSGKPEIVRCGENGAFIDSCLPPKLFIPFDLQGGLAYDALRDTFLATFANGEVFEIGLNCAPHPEQFSFSLESLGEDYAETGYLGGSAILRNTLIVCGREAGAVFQPIIFAAGNPFTRGDANQDELFDVSDGVFLANYLFAAGTVPECLDAADANDDGVVALPDVVAVLFGAFYPELTPWPEGLPEPFPEPGTDPTRGDPLGCESEVVP